MAKSKKRKDETSESEESTDSSSSGSSSDSSTTESASSEEESGKKRKLKKVDHHNKSKKRKKRTSPSSSSSSSDSEQESSSSSSSDDEKSKKKKVSKKAAVKDKKPARAENEKVKTSEKPERRVEHKNIRTECEDVKKESSDSHNKSKWDSPSLDVDDGRRDRQRNRDRDYHDNHYQNSNRRYQRYEHNNRGGRNFYRRNDHWQRPDNRDYDRRQDQEYEHDNDRERDRDRDFDRNNFQKNYRSRDRNYNDRRYDDRENRDHRDDRENRRSRSPRRPRNFPRRHSGEDNRNYEWGKREENDKSTKPEDREKPNFEVSGKLAEDTNKVNGIVIKYAEPLESRKPKRRWRLYPFKGEKALATLYIHRQSCYLVGRDRKICDLPVDHPSCSKQHAALQYRLVPFEREDGSMGKRVRPYLIDLESANGTFINNKKIDAKKYIELLEKDVIKFGFSSREYVLLHENSKEDQMDDDIMEEVQVKEEPAE